MLTRINLLPPEYRKKERTPLRTLLPVLASVTVSVAACAFWAWLHFGQLAEARVEHQGLDDSLKQKKPRLAYLQSLRTEKAEYEDRAKTILDIAASRVPWTKKLDQFYSVVADDGGGENYLIWLENFEVKPPDSRTAARDKKSSEGEKVTFSGLSFAGVSDDTEPLARFNVFHEAIQHSAFFREDFLSISNPAGKSIAMDDDLAPTRAWTVDLALTMRGAKSGTTGAQAEVKTTKGK